MKHKVQTLCWAIVLLFSGCRKAASSVANAPPLGTEKDSITFSGYTWQVVHSTGPASPGPNLWSSRNAWVDEIGRLHLRVHKDAATGQWSCAEIYSANTFGFGTYQFWIDGELGKLNQNLVLGLFTYSGRDGSDEMDVEFSRWGIETAPNASCTVWPAYGSNGQVWTVPFSVSADARQTTVRFTRSSSAVKFQTMKGFTDDNSNEFFAATDRDSLAVSQALMPVHMNLWLFEGQKPSDDKEVEIIVNRFTFLPE